MPSLYNQYGFAQPDYTLFAKGREDRIRREREEELFQQQKQQNTATLSKEHIDILKNIIDMEKSDPGGYGIKIFNKTFGEKIVYDSKNKKYINENTGENFTLSEDGKLVQVPPGYSVNRLYKNKPFEEIIAPKMSPLQERDTELKERAISLQEKRQKIEIPLMEREMKLKEEGQAASILQGKQQLDLSKDELTIKKTALEADVYFKEMQRYQKTKMDAFVMDMEKKQFGLKENKFELDKKINELDIDLKKSQNIRQDNYYKLQELSNKQAHEIQVEKLALDKAEQKNTNDYRTKQLLLNEKELELATMNHNLKIIGLQLEADNAAAKTAANMGEMEGTIYKNVVSTIDPLSPKYLIEGGQALYEEDINKTFNQFMDRINAKYKPKTMNIMDNITSTTMTNSINKAQPPEGYVEYKGEITNPAYKGKKVYISPDQKSFWTP